MARCCLILGDQLSHTLSALQTLDTNDSVLLVEVWSEATYVKHHPQKIALTFAAMRHFADALRRTGRSVHYVKLTDPANTQSIGTEVARCQSQWQFSGWVMTEPGEWRLRAEMETFEDRLGVPVEICEDTRFITTHAQFAAFLATRKQPRMEHFYRQMRQRTGILMDGKEPEGGQWNFDHDNRQACHLSTFPKPPRFPETPHLRDAKALVAEQFPDHFGSMDDWLWPVTPEQAEEAIQCFLTERLPLFGTYQDALVFGQDTVFHGLISSALHLGLLDPLTVCRRAEQAYRDGLAPLNAVEGFIRQILGWREYVRGLYWAYMPEYGTRNALDATAPLPAFYWDPERTRMRCMGEAIRNTRDHAYAHHIQRLMVTGNFALIAGLSVEEVCAWYLAVYVDAYEWVELPNTLGMALFADGGLLASKPYCASGKYIDRMSDYCRGCHYDVKRTVGTNACPLNTLYWDFLMRHASRFQSNPRMAMILKNIPRMSADKASAIQVDAQRFNAHLAAHGDDLTWEGGSDAH